MIPYGRQHISPEDIEAVIAVLKSDWLTQGPAIGRFEHQFAERCGAGYGVAVNSATSALHIACLALGVGKGDAVWTSPNSFVASANCAKMCGAEVDFVDIDLRNGNMNPIALAEKLAWAKGVGKLPKVLIPVHFAGQPCDMKQIRMLADSYGVALIEDASHAVGAKYMNDPIGGGRYSDITVFSFHPVKIITTGEGGLALTNNEALAEKMRLLRSHGITRDADVMEGVVDGSWYYQQLELGFNYRMTDIQAALGTSQMHRLDDFVARRRELAARYDLLLDGLPLERLESLPDRESSWHLYVVHFNDAEQRRMVYEHLQRKEIRVNVHYIPIHLQPYYRRLGFNPGDFAAAEEHYRRTLSLPLYFGLTNEEQSLVVENLASAMN